MRGGYGRGCTVGGRGDDRHGFAGRHAPIAFFDDNGAGGTGELVTGPATPPLGSGSARLALTGSSQGYALGTPAYAGTPLADITSLGYRSYQSGPTLAIALQFDVSYRTSDTSYDGRLVFEPYQHGHVTVDSG